MTRPRTTFSICGQSEPSAGPLTESAVQFDQRIAGVARLLSVPSIVQPGPEITGSADGSADAKNARSWTRVPEGECGRQVPDARVRVWNALTQAIRRRHPLVCRAPRISPAGLTAHALRELRRVALRADGEFAVNEWLPAASPKSWNRAIARSRSVVTGILVPAGIVWPFDHSPERIARAIRRRTAP
jgi:hypothetical protein